jgi:hypothetical protein
VEIVGLVVTAEIMVLSMQHHYFGILVINITISCRLSGLGGLGGLGRLQGPISMATTNMIVFLCWLNDQGAKASDNHSSLLQKSL